MQDDYELERMVTLMVLKLTVWVRQCIFYGEILSILTRKQSHCTLNIHPAIDGPPYKDRQNLLL
jgi:hypothetical protein